MAEIAELLIALVFGMAVGYVSGLCTYQKLLRCSNCVKLEKEQELAGLPERRKA